MAITLVGAVTGNNNSTAYSVDFNSLKPRVGDLVLVSIFTNATNDRDMSVTTAGYTEICDLYSNDTSDAQLSIWYKMLTSLEWSLDVNQSGTRTVVQLFRGVDTTTPIDVASVTASVTNTGVIDNPSITPVTSGAWVLALGVSAAAASTPTVPSGYSDMYFHNDYGTFCYSRKSRTSGAEDPGAYGGLSASTSNSYVACTIALRPSSAPVPPTPTTPYISDWVSNGSVKISGINIECSMTGLSFSAGDLIFCYIQGNALTDIPTTPSGWTDGGHKYNGAGASYYSRGAKLIYKVANGSETNIAYTSSWNSGYPHTCLFFTVKNVGTPPISGGPTSSAISGTSSGSQIVPTPSITNSRGGITIILGTSGLGLGFTATVPTGYTLLAVSQGSSALAFKATGGGVEDPSDWGLGANWNMRALLGFTIGVGGTLTNTNTSFLLFME